MKTVFVRVLEELEDKERALRVALAVQRPAASRQGFEVEPIYFGAVPGSPFAYWVSERLRDLFTQLAPFESGGRTACVGDHPGDGFRFLRLWHETWLGSAREWVPYQKGGVWSPYYCDIALVADWDPKQQSYRGFLGRPGRASTRPSNFEQFFRRGLTWPRRTQSKLSPRALPSGCVFADKGPAAFVAGDEPTRLLSLLAIAVSRPFASLVEFQLAAADARRGGAAHSYEVGVIQRTPVPDLAPADEAALASLAHRAWSLKRRLDTRTETSHAFVLPALLFFEKETLAGRAAAWNEHVREVEAELAAIQAEIDGCCFELYGINDEDRRAITEGFVASTSGSEAPEVGTAEGAEEEDEAEAEIDTDTAVLGAELVSWAVGVAFGRFDVHLATGDRQLPAEPDPFDPLPVCSPGMLTGDDGLPLASPPVGYPLSFPEDGILVDDPGHPLDLTAAVRAVFEAVFGSRADSMWQELAVLLDPRDHDLQRWLASGFFEHHLRRHSKSRRKAPILWQLGIPSGRYSVWCYAHRMTRDSLLSIQNDIVGPKLATEERRLSSLVTQAGQTPSARERADIAIQQTFIEELRTLADEVRRVAPLWNPELDDGIVLVIGPLWRLLPTHKAWQKELHTKWDELVAGKYDWAHVAMHLWPARVVPKCATDRSLAIAHGLEDVFWAEANDGKWAARKRPTRPIDELIAERTSPAIKASVVSLVGALSPFAGGRRSRNSRQTF